MVCCNLCISTDGYQSEIRAMTVLDLEDKIIQTIANYKAQEHLKTMKNLLDYSLTEKDFAQIKKEITEISIIDASNLEPVKKALNRLIGEKTAPTVDL